MGKMMDNVRTIDSAVRTLLLTVLIAGLVAAGYWGFLEYSKRDRLLAAQEAEIRSASAKLSSLQANLDRKQLEIESLQQHVEKLQTSMHLLKTDQRLARINVLSIQRNDKGRAIASELEFVELSPHGDNLSAPKKFKLPGDVIYIDNWIVKFDDSYTEKGDVERGTSLCLFRRIFSEEQSPNEGFSLDEVGMRPQAYARGGRLSDFETKLWSEFWEFSNDAKKASDMGIRAANGEAVSVKVREGKSYAISLRASDGLSIKPIADESNAGTRASSNSTAPPNADSTASAKAARDAAQDAKYRVEPAAETSVAVPAKKQNADELPVSPPTKTARAIELPVTDSSAPTTPPSSVSDNSNEKVPKP